MVQVNAEICFKQFQNIMIVKIKKGNTIQQIKAAFHAQVPFLRIEFFHHSHDHGEGSPKSDMIADDIIISDISKTVIDGELIFNKEMKIEDIEDQLKKYFGLNVQIFRKMGKLWLESTTSDEWTLEKVEEMANEYS